MPQPSLYSNRAEYYDAIYHWKNYGDEAKRLHELLTAEDVPDGALVIEAACGTGRYLAELCDIYNIHGFDLNPEMIAIAKKRLPQLKLDVADMCDFRVDQPAAALLCLFSSIGYVFPEDRLRAAAKCFARAVQPNGVLIIEPWIAPEVFTPGFRPYDIYQSDELKLCRACNTKREGEIAVLDFHWLASREGASDIEHFTERHELWLCPRPLMLSILDEAGFDCRIEENGLTPKRGLIVGQRR